MGRGVVLLLFKCTAWQGGRVFSRCNLRSPKITVFAHASSPGFIPNRRLGPGQHGRAFHRAQKCSAPPPAARTTCAWPLPQPLVIPFPAAYSERNWEDRGHGNPEGLPMGDKLSFSSVLPSAETASSPSGLLQNTGLLIKRG